MKEKLLYGGTWIAFLALMPYLLSSVVNGAEMAFLNRSYNLEYCLPVYLSMQISDEKELEMVKAQAVVARTNLYYMEKTVDLLTIFSEIEKTVDNYSDLLSLRNEKYMEAVVETEDIVLTYEGEVKRIPYHECSSGKTRDGKKVFHDPEYAYLKSVDSSWDQESADYLSCTYLSEDQLAGEMEIQEYDEAGYVLSLSVDGRILEGEAFRKGMELASSNFSFEKIENQYKVVCKGKGHGLGLSQYGGNYLAKKGSSWQEILEIYFPSMTCKLFEEIC